MSFLVGQWSLLEIIEKTPVYKENNPMNQLLTAQNYRTCSAPKPHEITAGFSYSRKEHWIRVVLD